MSRPIVVDIDGTMSRPDRSIEGRVFDLLRNWDEPVVVATGKAFPYPVALCGYIGIPVRVIAENGGVVATESTVEVAAGADRVRSFVAAYREAGYSLGWADADLANRWRETEVAINREQPRGPIDEFAEEHGLRVIDSGYAYHVLVPGVSKGRALESLAELLGLSVEGFAAVGDSENDVSTFGVVGMSYAVANGDDRAKTAADHVTSAGYAEGLFEALAMIRSDEPE